MFTKRKKKMFEEHSCISNCMSVNQQPGRNKKYTQHTSVHMAKPIKKGNTKTS